MSCAGVQFFANKFEIFMPLDSGANILKLVSFVWWSKAVMLLLSFLFQTGYKAMDFAFTLLFFTII